MLFVQLTSPSDGAIWVNVAQIVKISTQKSIDGKSTYTELQISDSQWIPVKEAPLEVVHRIHLEQGRHYVSQ